MPKKLIIIRHGETDYNRKEIVQGQMDIGLNGEGIEQARSLVKALKDEQIDVIYSSDLQRAYETAKPLADYLQKEIIATDKLRERALGPIENHSWSEVREDPNEYYKRLHDESNPDWKVGSAESLTDLYNRVTSWVLEMEHEKAETVAIVSHGGTLKVLFKALGFDELSNNCSIANTDFTIIEKIDGDYTLISTTMTHCERKLSIEETLQLKLPTVVKD